MCFFCLFFFVLFYLLLLFFTVCKNDRWWTVCFKHFNCYHSRLRRLHHFKKEGRLLISRRKYPTPGKRARRSLLRVWESFCQPQLTPTSLSVRNTSERRSTMLKYPTPVKRTRRSLLRVWERFCQPQLTPTSLSVGNTSKRPSTMPRFGLRSQ